MPSAAQKSLDDFVGDCLTDPQTGRCSRTGRVANMNRAGLIDKQKVIDQFSIGGDGLGADAGRSFSKMFSPNLRNQSLKRPHKHRFP